jgi:transcriptional regulator with XRE-family HTH domain
MTTWRQAKAKLHLENPRLKEEYEKLGPRFAAISELIGARERMQISQSELARRMNVKPNVVNRLESAQHSPLLDTVIEYAGALGLDVKLRLTKRPTSHVPLSRRTRGSAAALATPGRRKANR